MIVNVKLGYWCGARLVRPFHSTWQVYSTCMLSEHNKLHVHGMAARSMRQRGKEDESSISLLSTDSDFGPQRVRRQYSHSAYLLVAIVVGVVIVLVVALAVGLGIGFRDEASGDDLPRDPQQRALALLSKYPVIDGYVDSIWMM